jgi:hypothetical protein
VLVALEQKDAAGIDRVFMSTLTDAKGAFVFCPLPSGTYDVVIVGSSSTGIAYAPTVVTGVSSGSAMAVVKLYAQAAPGTGAALLNGVITSASSTGATSADVQISVLSQLASGLVVTVPLIQNSTQTSAVLAVSTQAGTTCPTGTDCAAYSMAVPALSPYSAAYSAGGVSLAAGPSPASYKVDAIAFVPQSGGTLDCSTSELQSSAVTPVAGVVAAVPTLAFSGCQ